MGFTFVETGQSAAACFELHKCTFSQHVPHGLPECAAGVVGGGRNLVEHALLQQPLVTGATQAEEGDSIGQAQPLQLRGRASSAASASGGRQRSSHDAARLHLVACRDLG